MNSTQFFEALKSSPHGFYLFYGPEEYAKDRALEALLAAVDPAFADFNVTTLDNPEAQAVVAACEALPLMADKRLVVVKNGDFFGAKSSGGGELARYLEDLCPSTILCVVHRGDINAKPKKGKAAKTPSDLFSAAVKLGGDVLFDFYPPEQAAKWAVSFAARQSVALPAATARRLVSMAGTALSAVASETQKLCDFAGPGNAVSNDMLDTVVRGQLEYTVFQMLEHFLAGRMSQGFAMLRQRLEEEGPGSAIGMLSFFADRLFIIRQAKRLLQSGCGQTQAVERLSGYPAADKRSYAYKRAVENAKSLTLHRLDAALSALADGDYAVKTGRKRDVDALMDALLTAFS